jgi:Na+/proline symporter
MSSTASELNALSSTTTMDIYRRSVNTSKSSEHYMKSSRWFTVIWGVFAILFATYATLFENLIQAVNLLGSLFYGSILGIFMVGFFMKWVGGKAVFIAAIITEILILTLHYFNGKTVGDISIDIGFLWYNAIGCLLVMAISAILNLMIPKNKIGLK